MADFNDNSEQSTFQERPRQTLPERLTHEKLAQLRRERDLAIVARCEQPRRVIGFPILWEVVRRDDSRMIYQQVGFRERGAQIVPSYGKAA